MDFKKALTFLCIALVIIPTVCYMECTCDEEDNKGRDRSEEYKLAIAIFSTSTIGVCIPMLGKVFPVLGPERDSFFLVKAFAARVILATGFIHVLLDAFENLTKPCLKEHPWGDFQFTGFVAMVAAYATSHFMKFHRNKAVTVVGGGEDGVVVPVHGGHSHGPFASKLLRDKVISQARRALRALRAIVRVQAIVRSRIVRKKVEVTLRWMQALQNRVGAEVNQTCIKKQLHHNSNRCPDDPNKKKRCQAEEGMHTYVQVAHQSLGRYEDNRRKAKEARISNSVGIDATTKTSSLVERRSSLPGYMRPTQSTKSKQRKSVENPSSYKMRPLAKGATARRRAAYDLYSVD